MIVVIKAQYIVCNNILYDLITSDLRHFMNHLTLRSGRVLYLPMYRVFLGIENNISYQETLIEVFAIYITHKCWCCQSYHYSYSIDLFISVFVCEITYGK